MSTETTTVTEYDDGSKIVETVSTEILEPGEVAEVEAEAIEAVTDTAVEIARIEAEKEIILAEISAETRIAEAEAYSEAATESQDDFSWRQNIETRLEQVATAQETLTAQLSTLLALEVQEANQSETNPASESVEATPVNPETEAEPSAPEPQKRPKKSRWI